MADQDQQIGALIAQVSNLETLVKQQNDRLSRLEGQLERTRGIGIGVVLATVGISSVGGTLISRLWSG